MGRFGLGRFGSWAVLVVSPHETHSVRTLINNLAYNCGYGSECFDDISVLRHWVIRVSCMFLGLKCLESEVSGTGA